MSEKSPGGAPGGLGADYGRSVPDLPTITAVRLTGARHRAELPLLVLGPSLGTSATQLWAGTSLCLTEDFDVVAWDLPGQGHNRAVPEAPLTLAELAAGVLAVVDEILLQRDEPGGSFAYVGEGVGAAVGLQLLLDEPRRVRDVVLLGSGARRGDPAPAAGLAAYDVSEVAAGGVRQGGLVLLDGIAGLSATDAPEEVARLVREHVLGESADASGRAVAALETHLREALDAGLTVEEIEQVLGRVGRGAE